jgi:hypothetical protein
MAVTKAGMAVTKVASRPHREPPHPGKDVILFQNKYF